MKAITTKKANCQDCHRCMRSCLVKAIGIERGQARLIDNKCVLCGNCVVECPQHAKEVSNRVADAKAAIAAKQQVVLSLAPSFIAAFPGYTFEQLTNRLLSLGFSAVEETAVGAEIVSQFYSHLLTTSDKPVISACCPVVVSTIKKYYPELTANLAPVVSPMQAHARLLKNRFGTEIKVVFAGPCIAKISEMNEPDNQIDAVITFQQLKQWLIEPNNENYARKTPLQTKTASNSGRYFPVAGGILKSFTQSEYTSTDIIAVDGLEKCLKVFDGLAKGEIAPRFIEALSCTAGCINGPAGAYDNSWPAKRLQLLQFAADSSPGVENHPEMVTFRHQHTADPIQEYQPTEEQIRLILERTGKFSRQDETNCGACGFNSCREKAIAVCQGLTTIDTCVPYMRSKAESFANIIVDNSLNAIIVVNAKLSIKEFNPSAEQMFDRKKETIIGSTLTEIINCSDILTAICTKTKKINRRVRLAVNGLVTNQLIIPVPEHDLVIIVMTDITAQEKNAAELKLMKNQTVEKATEIINRQMQIAQEIAGLLGETTAETKAALLGLVSLLKDKEDM